jgi:uncharacterized protein YchJ
MNELQQNDREMISVGVKPEWKKVGYEEATVIASETSWVPASNQLATAVATAAVMDWKPNDARPKQRPFRYAGARLGRNQPCHCGSGRKFKKCCKDGKPQPEPKKEENS